MEQKKMLRIGAVNCEDFSSICEKESITEFPTYRVYPPFPAPVQDHLSGDAELNSDTLKKMSFKHIGNRVIEITSQNHDVFKDDNPGKPKVLLFTDKAKTPIVYRALSTYFDVSLPFKSLIPHHNFADDTSILSLPLTVNEMTQIARLCNSDTFILRLALVLKSKTDP